MALLPQVPTKPTSYSTKWADTLVNNGANSSQNKVSPTTNHQNYGWGYPEQPPRNIMNWWQNAVYKWIDYLGKYIDLRVRSVADNFGYDIENISGLSMTINAGRINIGHTFIGSVETAITLPANQTSQVWLDISGGTATVQHGFGGAVPVAANEFSVYFLYTVVTDGTTVTSIFDRRTPTMIRKASMSAVTTGTDNTSFVTPYTLKNGFVINNATTSTYGKVRLAENADFENSTTRTAGANDVITVGNLDDTYLTASESYHGVVILATNNNILNNGTTDNRSVGTNPAKPISVAAMDYSNAQANPYASGFVRRADNSDCASRSGTDAQSYAIANKVLTVASFAQTGAQASTTLSGFARRATNTEVTNGTNVNAYVVPSDLKTAFDIAAPVGTVVAYAGTTTPTGWEDCDGSVASSSELQSVLGTTYGSAGKKPDLRGEFIRGWIDDRSATGSLAGESGRARGSWQDSAFKSHTHTIKTRNDFGDAAGENSPRTGASTEQHPVDGAVVTTDPTGNTYETRPRNVALKYIIKG